MPNRPLKKRNQSLSGWKQIAVRCIRCAAAASIPLYSCLSPRVTAQADEPLFTRLEDVFDESDFGDLEFAKFDLSQSLQSVDLPVPLDTDSEESLYRFRAGMTHFDHVTETHLGGTYGIEGIVPIEEEFGAHWAMRFNQFEGATQYLGTVGAYKRSTASGDIMDSFGTAIVVDMFTDSRVSDLFLAQLRGQAGFALDRDTAIGTSFTLPLNDDVGQNILAPGTLRSYSAVESIGMYVTRYVDDFLASAEVGYRKWPNSVYVDVSVRKPIVQNQVFGFVNTRWIEDDGSWQTWAGVEIRLGGAESDFERRETWDDPVIANTFNYGENKFWDNVAENPLGGIVGNGGNQPNMNANQNAMMNQNMNANQPNMNANQNAMMNMNAMMNQNAMMNMNAMMNQNAMMNMNANQPNANANANAMNMNMNMGNQPNANAMNAN